ncbi:putative GHMP kinase domain-containing protein [Helianthus annuus]|nr:putative GHMP kinase domain-containing protein [Helianthus annuus]
MLLQDGRPVFSVYFVDFFDYQRKGGTLILGMETLKKAANGFGAYGCTISGSGSTVVVRGDGDGESV